MNPSLIQKPPSTGDRVAQWLRCAATAQWCSRRMSAVAESFGMSSSTSQPSLLGEYVYAALSRSLFGARDRARLGSLFALDTEADQGADRAAELDRLVGGQVAEMLHLQLAIRVLVHGQRVDHVRHVACPQPLKFGDDLSAEVGLVEPQHDELHGPIAMSHFLV